MHDHEEMDMLMDVTGAVVGMEESDLSLGREEHLMDELMESVVPEMMDATGNISVVRGVVAEADEWQDDTIFQDRNFKEWVELEMEKLEVIMAVGPVQVLVSGQENVALGLAVINPGSYATPKKTYTHLKNELWGQALSNNVLTEIFGPTMCSTLRQELSQALAAGGAGTHPTLPVLLSPEPVSSQGLAISHVASPPIQTGVTGSRSRLHTERVIINNIQNPSNNNIISDEATFANLPKASISVQNLSRKPKPWHLVKKHGIIPDGLVQAWLTHFQ